METFRLDLHRGEVLRKVTSFRAPFRRSSLSQGSSDRDPFHSSRPRPAPRERDAKRRNGRDKVGERFDTLRSSAKRSSEPKRVRARRLVASNLRTRDPQGTKTGEKQLEAQGEPRRMDPRRALSRGARRGLEQGGTVSLGGECPMLRSEWIVLGRRMDGLVTRLVRSLEARARGGARGSIGRRIDPCLTVAFACARRALL